jgi:hypothetical protein
VEGSPGPPGDAARASPAPASSDPGGGLTHQGPNGSAGALGGGPPLLLIALLLIGVALAAPGARRRLFLPRPLWRPVLFVSLLERPG